MNALLKMPGWEDEVPEGYELSRGRWVETSMGAEASEIGNLISFKLTGHVLANGLGKVYNSEGTSRCFPKSLRSVRKPDVSFIRTGRLQNNRSPGGDLKIVPDVIVEVVSRNDKAAELEEKIDDYLAVKVPLFWIVHPNMRCAYVYHSDRTVRRIADQDDLDGEDVVPGFRCRLAEVLVELTPEETSPEGDNP